MAQARVKATGEIVELAPGSKDGRFCMQDTKSGDYYTWDELETIAVKAGVAPVSVSAVQITVSPTVSGTIDSKGSV